MIRRYLVFSGHRWYPDGGWSDFRGSFDTVEEAERAVPTGDSNDGWAHIVDTEAAGVVRFAGYANDYEAAWEWTPEPADHGWYS